MAIFNSNVSLPEGWLFSSHSASGILSHPSPLSPLQLPRSRRCTSFVCQQQASGKTAVRCFSGLPKVFISKKNTILPHCLRENLPWFWPLNMVFSCKFSNKSNQWIPPKTFQKHDLSSVFLISWQFCWWVQTPELPFEAWAAIHHLDQAPDMEPGLFFGEAPVDKVIKWYQLGWLTSQSTCF